MKIESLLALATLATAGYRDHPGDQVLQNTSAVQGATGKLNFGLKGGSYDASYYRKRWACAPFIQTRAIWYRAVITDTEKWKKALDKDILQIYNKRGEMNLTMDDMMEMYENGTKYAEDPKNISAVLYAPVAFNQTAYDDYYPTVHEFYKQLDLGTYYGAGLLSWWMFIFLLGMISNLGQHAFFAAYQKLKGHQFRKHVSMPALWGYKHCQPSGGWLGGFISMCTPTRMQALVVTGYLIMSFIFMFTQFDLFTPNYYFKTKGDQLARYLADRTGIMAFTQVPIVFLFGGRNNLFMWLTGWSFDTFNIYHRWTSRVMVLYAVIHSICYSYLMRGKAFGRAASQFYWIMGTVATICCSLILFQGLHFFRSRWYETFLVIHLVLAVAFVVGLWYHCVTLGWMQWVYCTIAIWGFDRACRIVRIIFSGGVVSGDFELVDPGQLIVKAEMDFSNRWNIYPGVHIYMYILNGKFWESHPFTVYQSPFAQETGKMTVLLKAKEGKTLSLANLLAKGGGKRTLKTFLEGPYGSKHPVGKYDSSIYVAGGIGITATYSYAVDVIRKSTAKTLIFTWVVRNETCLSWFKTELDTLLADPRVEVNLYVTGGGGSAALTSTGSESDSKHSEKSCTDLSPRLNIIYGRPDMTTEMPAYLERCAGNTAVVVCGPPILNDDVRLALVRANDCTKVDYFEEAFSW